MVKKWTEETIVQALGRVLLFNVALIVHQTFLCICTITKIGNGTEEIARIGEEVNMKPLVLYR